ncbi:precorrin-2 dehydrogenase/sirohydrochlorin ferrochelatase family protein [Sphingobium nicotianae]|uniref:precorrin-2 dehydrogenase n=1 Tax=Sphingobium nicotianae TaxID=2782607 RepID=A0A9X1DF09_9SPHN|nr:NAD(P)-dependent oxidoreductase [Sphingobium nicotianae]MBT2188706.1 siroheme synthase [Sphingobium nicotianae]
MHSLPLFLTLAGRPVILIGTGEAADAKRRLIARAGAMPVGEDNGEARIAFVALDDEAEAAAVAARLKARGLLINVVDRPALCDFTTPAIVDRDPVLVAIATGGMSAGLAAALRQRLENLLPARLGDLATALHAARSEMRAIWPDPAERRHMLARALAPEGVLDPLGADPDVGFWLDEPGDGLAAETQIIHLRSADPDDLTLREARSLGLADRIVHDGRVPDAILARARADAARIVLPVDATVPGAPGLTVILRITPM